MKKSLSIILIVFVLFLMSGCEIARKTPLNENTSEEEKLSVADYSPFESDKKYIYVGEGNEYADYTIYTDYIDIKTNRMQTRMNSGGTETIKVLEMKDGKLSVLLTKGESYYRDNLLNTVDSEEVQEILLMEPLVKGTQWTLNDNRIRRISTTDIEVKTPIGTYNAIEVTTEGPNDVIKDYYAPDVGLVKTVFLYEDIEISSTLSEIKTDEPFSKSIEFYYPGEDGKIYIENKTLSFYTNDISRIKIQELMREKAPSDTLLPLISPNTKINSLYLGKDNIAYIDLSKEFINEMNLGASYESMVLQGIANTIGSYYGVQRVYLTVENMPYESGHILLKKGETLSVNMDSVQR